MSVTCPEVEQLQQLVHGEMAPEPSDRCYDHVEQCPACGDSVEGLLAADPIIAVVRGQPAQSTPLPAPIIELMQRLSALRAAPTVVADGATPTPDGDAADDCTALFSPAQTPDEIGRLGGYRILKLLGAGGMAQVYLAEDLTLRRQVALKVMRPTLADRAAARKRFLREARAVAAVEHENIVTIHQVGEERGVAYLAMPLLKGSTLEARLRDGAPLPLSDVLRLGQQICRGLSAAHERGLVHRDVKPGNIWIEPDGGGRVKLLDFGLACEILPRRTAADDGPITELGTLIGTPAYLAPEQARGLPVDGRADLFSLGCVLYRMCTGRLPFDGDDPVSVIVAITTQEPVPPIRVNPAVPRALSDLILRLLAKDPAKRPASAAEVRRQLADMERAKSSRRRPWVAVLATAAALLAGGILLAEIIIRIKDKDGKTIAETTVPEGGSFEALDSGSTAKEGRRNKVDNSGTFDDASVPMAPETMAGYDAQVGDKITFRVTGSTTGSVWGDQVYTLDSSIATAAVHAGAIKAGQTGLVTVMIVPPPQSFRGTKAHGVTSQPWDAYPGAYTVARGRGGKSRRDTVKENETVSMTDPTQLSTKHWEPGTLLTCRIKGTTNGTVWGSGPYSIDSDLATAAVHAGILKAGQIGSVIVKVIKSPPSYRGSTANGVTTLDYEEWPAGAFLFVNGKAATIVNPEQVSKGIWKEGTILTVRMKGDTSGSVWGSGPYTLDSDVGTAAVHAGLLKAGQVGTATIEVIKSPAAYRGSTANGVTTEDFGAYAPGAFIFLSSDKGQIPEKLPDPGSLSDYSGQKGQRLTFEVTGKTTGMIWGAGPYTLDSELATAAVHAGILKDGEIGTVTVEIIASPEEYTGTTANGVTSSSYEFWPAGAFKFIK